MKYLKTFENIKQQIWVIPLKMPDFLLSLHEIGMNDKNVKDWMNLHRKGVFDYPRYKLNQSEYKYPDNGTITIKKNLEYPDSYTWYSYPSREGDDDTEFMGKLECTPKEIQDYYDEIELQNNIKQYNL